MAVLPVSTAQSQNISSVGKAAPQNITALIGSDGKAGVYWQGSDGNFYVKNNLGQVANAGSSNNGGNFGGLNYRQIANPNPSQPAAPTNNTTATATISGGGGNSGYVAPSEADTSPLLASLASLDTILGNKNSQSQAEHDRAIQGYDAQDKIDQDAITQNTTQNETNLTSDDWKALLNAANGATGLRGTLASIGALSGSGNDVVRHLTGLAASSDQGDARKTFDSNATSINQAAAQTSQLEKQRRADADATFENAKQNNNADVLTSKQSIFQKLADLYGTGTSQGNSYASQAASLAAPIAATTRATVAPYAASSSLYSAPALKSYLAGTQNLQASATPASGAASSTPINSPAYVAPGSKKDATLTGVA